MKEFYSGNDGEVLAFHPLDLSCDLESCGGQPWEKLGPGVVASLLVGTAAAYFRISF